MTVKEKKAFSLMDGSFGECTVLFNEYLLKRESKDIHKLQRSLNRSLEGCIRNLTSIGVSICDGLAGIYFVFLKLEKEIGTELLDEKTRSVVEEILAESYCNQLVLSHWDYLYGAGGILNTLISSKNFGSYIDKIITGTEIYLTKNQKFLDGNLYYESYMYPNQINMGIPHGLGGFILMLLSLVKFDVQSAIIKETCFDLADTLRRFFRKDNNNLGSFFPPIYDLKADPIKSRIAWCYGDLGILYTMLKLEESNISVLEKDEYPVLIQSVDKRSYGNDHLCQDNCLCHGYSGNALLEKKVNFLIEKCNITEVNMLSFFQKTAKSHRDNHIFYDRHSNNFGENSSLLNGSIGSKLYFQFCENPDKAFPIDSLLLLN